MSDSEEEFIGRKKQFQPLIDSEDDENDGKASQIHNSFSQSSSHIAESNVAAGANALLPASSSLNGEKFGQLSPINHSHCASDIESSPRQNSDKAQSQSSVSDRSSQSNVSQSNSVRPGKRKSYSNSDSSDSDSHAVSNQSSSQRITKRLSPDPQSGSQSSNTTVVNRSLNDTQSSAASSESDSCSEADKAHDASVNSIVSSTLSPKEKSNNASDSENITIPKARKYKLLNDDNLSDDQKCDPPVKHSGSESDGVNLDPAERLKLKKEKQKKKLKMLNELKKKELKEKNGNASSDSENEDHETFKSAAGKHNDSSRVSSDYSAASDSESEKSKSKAKAARKSLPQRKAKKIDPKLEIKSKTQKMIRENRISLPYHQPRKRSLDEFLARRKNTPSIPLKATDDVLHVVSEHILKREKEVEVFYKSESDHSDDGSENVATVDETANNRTHELPNQENLPEKSIAPVCNIATAVEINDPATEVENNVEIRDKPESTHNEPVADKSCDQDQISHTTEMISGSISSTVNFEMPIENSEFSDQSTNGENCGIGNKSVSETTNIDLADPEKNNVPDKSDPSPQNIDLVETSGVVKENPVANSLSELPGTESASQLNSVDSCEAMPKNQNHPVKKSETEDNLVAALGPKEPVSMDTEPPDTDDFDLTIQDSSTSKQSAQNDTEPPDTDDFDLMIQDSCNDAVENKKASENITPEPAADLRSKKLALFSRLKIPLRSDIRLQASPDLVIELETPSVTESEFGVYELKKKFAFHSSLRNQPVRKTSTKLSILRTETDSQGEIIDVVKEIIDINCGEVKEDEVKEKFSTPGAKHLNFKEHMLKSLIDKKRAKWQEYQQEKRKLYGTQSSDEEEFDEDYSKKPDFEPYHPEDELDDDELEEDDVELKEKKKSRNDFVDDEAEVSFDEDENLKGSDVEDEEEVEAEEAAERDHESADDEADVEADDKDEDVDSDSELLSTEKETTESNQASAEIFKKPLPSQNFPIFKYNTTGTDLENKVLGFENIFEEKSKPPEDVTSSQLFEICSGKFSTQVEKLNSSDPSDSEFFMDSQHGEDSQNINLSLQDTNDGFRGSDDNLLDNRSLLFLSDDEYDNEELFARKKKLMRLDDSDDEEDAPAPVDEAKSDKDEGDAVDEYADEMNEEEDADEVDALDDDVDELAYNSEEEIITKQKAAEFFENEAELSESEWGSEDENEQNLDELEKEAGDDDVLDEDEVQKELGKIHMRQLLDDDQHDVRMLKEMLLEDGDLHSDGKRQRKFQWTNLDDNGFFSKMANDSDEEVANEEDEEEVDTNWRKIRHEREMFISQQEKRNDLLEDAEDETSDSLPLPQTNSANVPAKSNKPSVVSNNNISSPDSKLPFKARFKCGSFLTRSKMLLDRLAVTVGGCKENVTGKAKNHRNFVFAAVSPEKELPNVPETKTEKRKISSKSIMARKKLKLASTNQSGLLAQLALRE